MVNPIHLRTLLETVRLGSFAGAANRLGYTASAVSQQMAALEREVGVTLFERSARRAQPTEAAAAMARHSVRVLADIDALLAATTSAHSTVAQELHVAIFPSLANTLISRVLTRPEWRGSDIDLRLWVADPSPVIQQIRSGREFDVAIVYQVADSGLTWPQAMRHEWLGDDHFRVVVPAGWGFQPGETASIQQLSGFSWIFHHGATSDAVVIDRMFRSRDLRPRTIAHSDDYAVTLELVAGGFAASYVPELVLHDPPAGVVALEVPELQMARRLFALTQTDDNSPRVSAFLDTTAEILADFGISRDGS